MVRTLKICFLSNFPVCSIINYGYHAVHCICTTYLIYNWKFVSFDSLDLHSLPLPPPPFSVSVRLALLFCFLNATCILNHDICLSLTDMLHVSVMPWIFPHVVADGKMPFSYVWTIIHPVYIPQFLYPFLDPWAPWLFLYLGYFK